MNLPTNSLVDLRAGRGGIRLRVQGLNIPMDLHGDRPTGPVGRNSASPEVDRFAGFSNKVPRVRGRNAINRPEFKLTNNGITVDLAIVGILHSASLARYREPRIQPKSILGAGHQEQNSNKAGDRFHSTKIHQP